jgi:hypothetical protein
MSENDRQVVLYLIAGAASARLSAIMLLTFVFASC